MHRVFGVGFFFFGVFSFFFSKRTRYHVMHGTHTYYFQSFRKIIKKKQSYILDICMPTFNVTINYNFQIFRFHRKVCVCFYVEGRCHQWFLYRNQINLDIFFLSFYLKGFFVEIWVYGNYLYCIGSTYFVLNIPCHASINSCIQGTL